MQILALSGSARSASTNTALLRAVARAAPDDIRVSVFAEIGGLPVFSPDLEAAPPSAVAAYIARVEEADGLLIASPEYVRSLPGGLKNAIDWLVSRETLVRKPIALLHASHRGDDMLGALRIVLATVSERFAPDLFLRFPLMKMSPEEIDGFVARPENAETRSKPTCAPSPPSRPPGGLERQPAHHRLAAEFLAKRVDRPLARLFLHPVALYQIGRVGLGRRPQIRRADADQPVALARRLAGAAARARPRTAAARVASAAHPGRGCAA